jgi:hypothetical protein
MVDIKNSVGASIILVHGDFLDFNHGHHLKALRPTSSSSRRSCKWKREEML